MYLREEIDRVREAVDLLELASEVTTMSLRGSQFVGRCPFHEERTPSFHVDTVRRVFHCFGCGAGGDALTLYQRLTGASFREALQALAERFHVPPPGRDSPGSPVSKLLAALDAAAGYYAEALQQPRGAPARSYLDCRQVPMAIREVYRLGFAPPDTRGLQDVLSARFGEEVLLAAGLVRRSSSNRRAPVDLFRNRILFPITDEAGRVLGFGGRLLDGDARGPKYLNGPNTTVFSKRSHFFGLSQALPALRQARRVFLVEGYFDVLALAAAAAGPALGLMSTSFHEEQVRRLARRAREIVLLLDGDRAGWNAEAAMAPALLRAGETVLRSTLPEGLDPAGVREAHGDSALRALCDAAEDVVLGSLRTLAAAKGLEEETTTIRSLLQLVRAVPDDARRLAYARRIAGDLGLPPEGFLELVLRQPG